MSKLQALAVQEAAGNGYTHMAVITADDLTETATNTAQDVVLADLPENVTIEKTGVSLRVPFENSGDSGFNTSDLSLGDTDSSTRFVNGVDVNKNGTPITADQYDNTAYGPYGADKQLIANFGSMSAKKLSDINTGEVHIFVALNYLKTLSDAHGRSRIRK